MRRGMVAVYQGWEMDAERTGDGEYRLTVDADPPAGFEKGADGDFARTVKRDELDGLFLVQVYTEIGDRKYEVLDEEGGFYTLCALSKDGRRHYRKAETEEMGPLYEEKKPL